MNICKYLAYYNIIIIFVYVGFFFIFTQPLCMYVCSKRLNGFSV